MRWQSMVLAAMIGLMVGPVSAADLVWVEAERFDDYGGWVNDAQFIDQMGSPYLLATGMGEPVRDAVTQVDLPHAGRWRVGSAIAIGCRSIIRDGSKCSSTATRPARSSAPAASPAGNGKMAACTSWLAVSSYVCTI